MGDKGGAYGAASSDTAFRKTWDEGEYAAKAAAREAREREEGKARYEAKLAGRKYNERRAATPPDAKETEARATRLDFSSQLGKKSMVAAGAAVGKRGKGAGFYCEACDLTFKDNKQLMEHMNSKQHRVNVGETDKVRNATLQEVRDRIEWLVQRKAEEERELRADRADLDERLQNRADEEERRKEEKRRKRREKRRKTEGGVGHDVDHEAKGNGIIA